MSAIQLHHRRVLFWFILKKKNTTQCVTAGQDSEDTPPRTCYDMELNSDAFRVLTGLCFFALAAGVAGYGFQVYRTIHL